MVDFPFDGREILQDKPSVSTPRQAFFSRNRSKSVLTFGARIEA